MSAVSAYANERIASLLIGHGGGSPCKATARKASPSRKNRIPNLASQMRDRVLQHSLEHRLKLAGRTRDDLQHLGGGGLLLQRLGEIIGALAQLVEQPGVLDRDHGLRGEGGDELDLLLGEGLNLLSEIH